MRTGYHVPFRELARNLLALRLQRDELKALVGRPGDREILLEHLRAREAVLAAELRRRRGR